jgi:hypothetical protein
VEALDVGQRLDEDRSGFGGTPHATAVTPAEAGAHERSRNSLSTSGCSWVPAFAGMTTEVQLMTSSNSL